MIEVALPVSGKPGSVGGRAAYFYRLVPLAGTPKPGDALLLALPPVPENDLRLLLNFLHAQQIPFVSLNPFFNYPLSSARGVLRSRMLLVSVPERPVDWTVARGTGGRLYRFVEMSGPGS